MKITRKMVILANLTSPQATASLLAREGRISPRNNPVETRLPIREKIPKDPVLH